MNIASTSNKIPTIINLIVGIASGFLALLLIRISYPILEALFDLWDSGMGKLMAQLIMWIVYFFIVYMVVITRFTKPQEKEQESEEQWR